jgi:hypothetical protein
MKVADIGDGMDSQSVTTEFAEVKIGSDYANIDKVFMNSCNS